MTVRNNDEFETARLIAALDARRREIASKGRKTWSKSGEFSNQAVDDCCSLFAAAGRLKDCGCRHASGAWLRTFFGDVYRRAQAGDQSACRVAGVIDGFLGVEASEYEQAAQ